MKACSKDFKIDGRLIRIARVEGEKFKFLDDPQTVLNALRKSGLRADLFTFIQRASETSPKYSYPMEWDNLAVLPVSTFEHWWGHQIGFKARNKAKQAGKKGVVLREVPFSESLLQGICDIYNECPIRQGRRFPHYGMTLERARGYAGTFLDSSIFIGAFYEDRLIGFVKLVIDESQTHAGLMHIVSLVGHRDKAPTNALLAQAVQSCANRGISYLTYSNFAYGKKQTDSLSDFKERNGFQRIDLPRYYIPLTLTGRLTLRFGLHHRLVDHLPEFVGAKLRELRNAWYNRKFRSVTELS
jgi:hypothetical protein